MDWLKVAQALPLGQQRRIEHDCGQGKSAVVYHTDDGWSMYCHRCSAKPFVPRPQESLAERLARHEARRLVESQASASLVPPMPPVTDVTEWPAPARVWLYKAGISNDDIQELGIYYHVQTDRVIIPIVSDGVLTYWLGRAYDWKLGTQRPKWLNPYQYSTGGGVLLAGLSDSLVIVEDYLSAHRVHRAGYSVHCLLGTKLTDVHAAKLLRSGCTSISVWLDNDTGRAVNPGQVAAASIGKKLRSYGLDVTNIVSDRDPKMHSKKEIQSILGGNHCHLKL